MKTTVDIADPLLEQARDVMREQGITLRQLVEDGLVRVLAERRRSGEPFRLRDARFAGNGLRPEFAGAPWENILIASYESRG